LPLAECMRSSAECANNYFNVYANILSCSSQKCLSANLGNIHNALGFVTGASGLRRLLLPDQVQFIFELKRHIQ